MIKRTFSEWSHRLRWLWVHLRAMSESSTFIHSKCFHYFRRLYYHAVMLIVCVINVSLSISCAQELPGLGLTLEAVETNSRAGLKVNTGSVPLVRMFARRNSGNYRLQVHPTLSFGTFILLLLVSDNIMKWKKANCRNCSIIAIITIIHHSYHFLFFWQYAVIVVSTWQAAKFNREAKLRATPTDLEE